MKIHKTSIPIDQFCEPFFCFLPDVNFPTSGSTPAQIPMWGLLLGLSVKSLHVGSQGQTRRDEGSRPLRGGSVIGRAQFVSPIHACFSFGACTIQSRRFWLSSSHFAISNFFVLACILSMRRLVSNRSQMLSSVSKPVAFIGSSSSGNTCATVPPSPAARIASSLRSRKEQNTTTGCSATIMTTKPLTKSTSCCGSRSCESSEAGQSREEHGEAAVLFSALSVDQAHRVGKEKAHEYPQANRLHRHVCRTGRAHGSAAPADGIVLRDRPAGQPQERKRRGCRSVGIPASGLSHSRGLFSPQCAPYARVLRSLRGIP